MATKYSLSDFNFVLPAELIAQAPAVPRDHARLMVYDRGTKIIKDDYFYNLGNFLPAETSLVINNSKVEKCRLRFGKIEIFVLKTINPTQVEALVRPGKKFKLNSEIELDGVKIIVTGVNSDGTRLLKLDRSIDHPNLDKHRLTPLPTYIKQDEALASEYQTIYAKPLGSKAAPTAGLHFTSPLLKTLGRKHTIIELTLHVGLGTFAPVKTEDLSQHKMHTEEYFLSALAAGQINQAKHITAVGTTSVRVLESARRPFTEQSNETDIFITPGYKFHTVDSLITNFHLPKSTLLMLTSAFIGSVEELHRIYQHAIAEKYRFYSFGDAMLIL